MSGDLNIAIGNDMDLEFELKSISGDIKSKYDPAVSESFGKKNSKLIIGSGLHKIYVKSVSGDIRIKDRD